MSEIRLNSTSDMPWCRGVSRVLFLSAMIISMSLLILPAKAYATTDIQFYKADISIDEEGRSTVQLVLTFKGPEKLFSFGTIGRIENLQATSNAGPVDCKMEVSGVSTVECSMELTDVQKELQIKFETNDFIKVLDETFYFSGDFSQNNNITDVSATLRLPEDFLLVGESISSSILSYPLNASAHIFGESIIITWNLRNILPSESLKFEVLYERVTPPSWFQLRMRHFVLLGASFAVVVGFIFVRYLRKSEGLVLSVLDEYERKVMDIITTEGEVKQRKVVELTGLSKAKVSRVVKNLANRGLIEVERMGRTNKLKPAKKKIAA